MSKQPSGYPKYAPSGYPRQPQAGYPGMAPQPMYPTSSYPQQQPYPQMSQPAMHPSSSSPYGVPPPPYTTTPQQMYPQAAPQPSYPVQQGSHMPMQYYPGTMPVAHGTYDAGARFGAGATPNIPPPPPGYAANQAQMAAAQGRPVVMRQNPDNWISGGSDGGYTVW